MSPRLLVLAAAVLFSTGGAVIKATTASGYEVAGLRSAFGVLALLALIPEARSRASWSPAVFPVALAYGATLLLFTLANKLTTAANAIFIQDTAPLYVLALSPLLLSERLQRRDLPFLASVGLGLALFLAASPAPQATAPDPSRGNVIAIGASITWALTLMGLRWLGTRSRPGANPGAAAAVAGNALVLLTCIPLMDGLAELTVLDWLCFAFLGSVQIGAAYALLTRATPHVSALELSVLLLLEPVLNPIFTFALHGEEPGVWSMLGGAIVLGATAARAVRYRAC